MQIDTLQDLYVFGIEDMNNGCGRSKAAMEEMRDAATHPDLRALMDGALASMDGGLAVFDQILNRLGVEPSHPQNLALTALGEEGRSLVVDAEYADPDLRDLAIVEKARNLAHYPEAGFAAFIAQARALGYEQDVEALTSSMSPSGENSTASLAMMDTIEADLLARTSRLLPAG